MSKFSVNVVEEWLKDKRLNWSRGAGIHCPNGRTALDRLGLQCVEGRFLKDNCCRQNYKDIPSVFFIY